MNLRKGNITDFLLSLLILTITLGYTCRHSILRIRKLKSHISSVQWNLITFNLHEINSIYSAKHKNMTKIIHHLMMGICSKKCIIRQFHRANVKDYTHANLDGRASYTPRLYGTAYCSCKPVQRVTALNIVGNYII